MQTEFEKKIKEELVERGITGILISRLMNYM